MRPNISEADRGLLSREFRTSEPQKRAGLTARVDRGVKVREVLHWYDETPPGGEKAGHRKHIQCAFGHMHWHGFVVGLDDGREILVGRDCAQKDFGLDWDLIVGQFTADRDRADQLRRVMALADALPGALRDVKTLRASGAVVGFDSYWASLMKDFGRLSRTLATVVHSSQGRLISSERVFSEKKTEKAAIAAAQRLVEDSDLPSLWDQVFLAPTPEKRQLAVKRWEEFVAQQPKQYESREKDMGECASWRLLRASERSTPSRCVEEAERLLEKLDLGRASERWTKREFSEMRSNIKEAFAKLDEAASLVDDLRRFAEAGNIERIAKWAQQTESREKTIGDAISADNSTLIGRRARLQLPNLTWPSLSGLARMRAAFSLDQEGRAASASTIAA